MSTHTRPKGPSIVRVLTLLQAAIVVVQLGLIGPLLAATAPAIVGNESFVVASSGMQPTLQVGDLAIVQPVRASELTVDDVITFRTPGDPDTVVTRRILFVGTDATGKLSLQTRGDADPVAESVSVNQSTLLGRLLYSVPRLGLLVNFVNQGLGRLLLLGMPGVLLLMGWLRARPPHAATADPNDERVATLLDRGQRALAVGYPQLAMRAADGVLAVDAHNRDAWLLKVCALKAQQDIQEIQELPEVGCEHVAA